MNPKHAKWPKRVPIIMQHAGKIPAEDIAKILGVSRSVLSNICCRKKISLRVPGLRSERMKANHPTRREREPEQEVVIDDRLARALWKPTQIHSNV